MIVTVISNRSLDAAELLALVGEPIAPSAADLADAQRTLDEAFSTALDVAMQCSQGKVGWCTFEAAERVALAADFHFAELAALVQ